MLPLPGYSKYPWKSYDLSVFHSAGQQGSGFPQTHSGSRRPQHLHRCLSLGTELLRAPDSPFRCSSQGNLPCNRGVQWNCAAWGRGDRGGEEWRDTTQPADTPYTGRGTDSALLRSCARWLHAPHHGRDLLQQNDRGRDAAAIDKLKDESEGPNEPCPPQRYLE